MRVHVLRLDKLILQFNPTPFTTRETKRPAIKLLFHIAITNTCTPSN